MKHNKAYILAIVLTFSTLIIPSKILASETNTGTPTQKKDELKNADLHRSNVASFVRMLLQIATTTGDGIGKEVRLIAQEQNNSMEKVSEGIKAIENRGKFKTFLLGTDFKNIGMIRSELAKTQSAIDKLNRTLQKMNTSTIAASTTEQIQNLTKEQERLKSFVEQNENRFSMFGWFVKMINK